MSPDSIESRLARLDEHMRGEIALINERLREADEEDQRHELAVLDIKRDLARHLNELEQRLGTGINVCRGEVAKLRRHIEDEATARAVEEKNRKTARKAALKWYAMALIALLGAVGWLVQIIVTRGGT